MSSLKVASRALHRVSRRATRNSSSSITSSNVSMAFRRQNIARSLFSLNRSQPHQKVRRLHGHMHRASADAVTSSAPRVPAHSAAAHTGISSAAFSSASASASAGVTKEKVAVIGSGNWGSVAARLVGTNARALDWVEDQVKVWVFEEELQAGAEQIQNAFGDLDVDHDGRVSVEELEAAAANVGVSLKHPEAEKLVAQLDTHGTGNISLDEFSEWWKNHQHDVSSVKLTDIINRRNENIKYLPGVTLGENVVAEPDLLKAVEGATLLVFVTPHQFIKDLCQQMKGRIAPGARAISLIKGMDVTPQGFELISSVVANELDGMCCSVLMGANIANEVAVEQFSEATVGYINEDNGRIWQKLFTTPYFHVNAVHDVEGVELCGTLKNIVALGAGFVDGLGLGNNSKAAIIRLGLVEMMGLSQALFPTVQHTTFFESCGVADLITTAMGGRNRKVAEAFVTAFQEGNPRSWDSLEEELLGGQKLQGVLTSYEVQEVLRTHKLEEQFPLITTIHHIVDGKLTPDRIVEYKDLPGLK